MLRNEISVQIGSKSSYFCVFHVVSTLGVLLAGRFLGGVGLVLLSRGVLGSLGGGTDLGALGLLLLDVVKGHTDDGLLEPFYRKFWVVKIAILELRNQFLASIWSILMSFL